MLDLVKVHFVTYVVARFRESCEGFSLHPATDVSLTSKMTKKKEKDGHLRAESSAGITEAVTESTIRLSLWAQERPGPH